MEGLPKGIVASILWRTLLLAAGTLFRQPPVRIIIIIAWGPFRGIKARSLDWTSSFVPLQRRRSHTNCRFPRLLGHVELAIRGCPDPRIMSSRPDTPLDSIYLSRHLLHAGRDGGAPFSSPRRSPRFHVTH